MIIPHFQFLYCCKLGLVEKLKKYSPNKNLKVRVEFPDLLWRKKIVLICKVSDITKLFDIVQVTEVNPLKHYNAGKLVVLLVPVIDSHVLHYCFPVQAVINSVEYLSLFY